MKKLFQQYSLPIRLLWVLDKLDMLQRVLFWHFNRMCDPYYSHRVIDTLM